MSNERVMRLGLTISAKQSQLTISKDVIRILGSPSYVCVLQGKTVLGWNPQSTTYEQLVEIMAKHDRERAKREKALKTVL